MGWKPEGTDLLEDEDISAFCGTQYERNLLADLGRGKTMNTQSSEFKAAGYLLIPILITDEPFRTRRQGSDADGQFSLHASQRRIGACTKCFRHSVHLRPASLGLAAFFVATTWKDESTRYPSVRYEAFKWLPWKE